MKIVRAVLVFFFLLVAAVAYAAWLDSRIAPGRMFAVRTAYAVQPLAALGGNVPNGPCNIPTGGRVYVFAGNDTTYVMTYLGVHGSGGANACDHGTTFIASGEEVEAMCGGLFQRALTLGFGR